MCVDIIHQIEFYYSCNANKPYTIKWIMDLTELEEKDYYLWIFFDLVSLKGY